MAYGRKTGGRAKGVPNKSTAQQKERAEYVMQIIESNYLEKDIKKLTAGQRTQLYMGMMEYVAPKLSRVDAKVDGKLDLSGAVIRFK